MADAMKATIASMLKGIERYNPENLPTLIRYVETQVRENTYDLEANQAVLKLYQFNPNTYNTRVTSQILLKALTNLPHTDFVLCKCLLAQEHLDDPEIQKIMYMADLLEMCQFISFWEEINKSHEIIGEIKGFEDSIRKFICHVINITYQRIEKPVLAELLGGLDDRTLKLWINKYGWREEDSETIAVANQEENIKTKNITEKIDFETVASIMAACR